MIAATVGMAIGQNSDVTAEAAGVVVMDNSLQQVDIRGPLLFLPSYDALSPAS